VVRKKITGSYSDDDGNIREWRSKAARWRDELERRKRIKEEKQALKMKKRYKKQLKVEAEEADRDNQGLPALSKNEAIRRCLESACFQAFPSVSGHLCHFVHVTCCSAVDLLVLLLSASLLSFPFICCFLKPPFQLSLEALPIS